jgi:hypothetical protein
LFLNSIMMLGLAGRRAAGATCPGGIFRAIRD